MEGLSCDRKHRPKKRLDSRRCNIQKNVEERAWKDDEADFFAGTGISGAERMADCMAFQKYDDQYHGSAPKFPEYWIGNDGGGHCI